MSAAADRLSLFDTITLIVFPTVRGDWAAAEETTNTFSVVTNKCWISGGLMTKMYPEPCLFTTAVH